MSVCFCCNCKSFLLLKNPYAKFDSLRTSPHPSTAILVCGRPSADLHWCSSTHVISIPLSDSYLRFFEITNAFSLRPSQAYDGVCSFPAGLGIQQVFCARDTLSYGYSLSHRASCRPNQPIFLDFFGDAISTSGWPTPVRNYSPMAKLLTVGIGGNFKVLRK